MAKKLYNYKKNNKPEVSYKVVPKKTTKVFTKKLSKTKKSGRYTVLLINNISFILLIIITAAFIGFIFWYLNNVLRNTNLSFENALNISNSFITVDSRKIQVASVVGSNDQLSREIENYQSAPDDLKNFLLKDYRAYKGNCVVNGKLLGPVEYKVENVVYDQFARLKRTCISNDSAIVAKIGGRWSVVTAGNSLPECRVVNDLNLPQGVTFNCTDGMVIYTNPNP